MDARPGVRFRATAWLNRKRMSTLVSTDRGTPLIRSDRVMTDEPQAIRVRAGARIAEDVALER